MKNGGRSLTVNWRIISKSVCYGLGLWLWVQILINITYEFLWDGTFNVGTSLSRFLAN